MRKSVAVAAVLLLAACRQPEPQNKNAASGASTNTAAAATNAAAPVTPEQAIGIFHERHEGMERIGKSTKTIGQQLKSESPDLAVIRSSAATITDLAARSPKWFPAGTGQEVLPKTRALPAIWQKPEDFAAKDRDLRRAANALKTTADAGDLDAIESSFDTLGKACKACHDDYRAEEHPQ